MGNHSAKIVWDDSEEAPVEIYFTTLIVNKGTITFDAQECSLTIGSDEYTVGSFEEEAESSWEVGASTISVVTYVAVPAPVGSVSHAIGSGTLKILITNIPPITSTIPFPSPVVAAVEVEFDAADVVHIP